MNNKIAKREIFEIVATIFDGDNQIIVNFCKQEINKLNQRGENYGKK